MRSQATDTILLDRLKWAAASCFAFQALLHPAGCRDCHMSRRGLDLCSEKGPGALIQQQQLLPCGLRAPNSTGSLTGCVSLLWISSTLSQTEGSLGVPFPQAVTQRPRGMETRPRFVLSPASWRAFSLPYRQTQSILTFPFFPCGSDLVTDSLYGTFLTV